MIHPYLSPFTASMLCLSLFTQSPSPRSADLIEPVRYQVHQNVKPSHPAPGHSREKAHTRVGTRPMRIVDIKPLHAIEDYFRQYPKDFDQRYPDEYFRTYRTPLLIGSYLFQVPAELDSCLLARESQFDDTSLSSAKAKGLTQVTAVAIADVNVILNTEPYFRALWDQYFLAFSSNDGPQNYPSPGVVPGTNRIELSADRDYSLEVDLAIHFVFIRKLMNNLSLHLRTFAPTLRLSQLDAALIIAMAYNGGQDRVFRALDEVLLGSLQHHQPLNKVFSLPPDWLARIRVPIETRRHGIAQLNCMQFENLTPPPAYKGKGNEVATLPPGWNLILRPSAKAKRSARLVVPVVDLHPKPDRGVNRNANPAKKTRVFKTPSKKPR